MSSPSVLPPIERKEESGTKVDPERSYWLQTGLNIAPANAPTFGGTYLRYTDSVGIRETKSLAEHPALSAMVLCDLQPPVRMNGPKGNGHHFPLLATARQRRLTID